MENSRPDHTHITHYYCFSPTKEEPEKSSSKKWIKEVKKLHKLRADECEIGIQNLQEMMMYTMSIHAQVHHTIQ